MLDTIPLQIFHGSELRQPSKTVPGVETGAIRKKVQVFDMWLVSSKISVGLKDTGGNTCAEFPSAIT